MKIADSILKWFCVLVWLCVAVWVFNTIYDIGHPKPVPCTTDAECMYLNPNLGDY